MKNKFLFTLCFLFSFNLFAQKLDVKTYIPKNALPVLPMLKEQQVKLWPTHPRPEVFGSLIEHESCISLTHSRCWSSKSQLKTSREEGAGFGQITRAYRADGSTRFDALQEMKDKHSELREWSWNNVYVRPDLQLAGIILKQRDNYGSLHLVKDPIERLNFTDASYNQGLGKTNTERRICGLTKGCDPQKWFGHVEKTCSGTNAVIYGTRGPCDISRHHVNDVINVRANKYKIYLQ